MIDLSYLLSQGEGYNLEFKESISDGLGKEICAFANASGGTILIGVTDDGIVKGIDITNSMRSQVMDTAHSIDPSILVELETLGNVLVVRVPEGVNKPYSCQGKFFLRQGPNSQQLKRDVIREFFQKEGLVLFDEKTCVSFDIEHDMSDKALSTCIRLSSLTPGQNRVHLLNNLGLLSHGYLRNAGVLLFADNIIRFISWASIICVIFQGNTKYNIIDKKEFDSDIYTNYTSTMTYLKENLRSRLIIKDGPHQEVLELPEDALREALINALCHRNYFMTSSILVEIYANRVEITNPGGLVRGLQEKDLGSMSLSRNPLLAGLFERMHLVEKVGSGIMRMREACVLRDVAAPEFVIRENWFTVRFSRLETVQKTVQTSEENSSEKIIILMKRDPRITAKEISHLLRINLRNAEKNIARLRETHKIERIGPNKSGYWKVND